MAALGEALRGCGGRSMEVECAWLLYSDMVREGQNMVQAYGPALPPAMLEARVDAEVTVNLCDLGVYHDELYAVSRGEVAVPATVEGGFDALDSAPVAVLLQDEEGAAVCRPYTSPCREHLSCSDHGMVADYDGKALVWHQCAHGGTSHATLPPHARGRLAVPPDKLLKLIKRAEIHPLVLANDGHDAGNHTLVPLYKQSKRGTVLVPDPGGRVDTPLLRTLSKCWPSFNTRKQDEYWGPDDDNPTVLEHGERVQFRRSRIRDYGKDPPRVAGFDCSNLFDRGYFLGTPAQWARIQARRCVHGCSYDLGCCDDPDLSD